MTRFFLFFNASSLVLFSLFFCTLGKFCYEDSYMVNNPDVLGGIHDSDPNRVEIISLARFAVDEHNKKENAVLEFARLLKAHEQLVSGTRHYLTLEVIDAAAGKKKIYDADVFVCLWENIKELRVFKHADDAATCTCWKP